MTQRNVPSVAGSAGEHEVPFVLGTFSISGSPPFPALVFDDGTAVSLHAVLPFAARLGLVLTGTESLFGLLQNWQGNFAALQSLVHALAYDDRARGHRGFFTSAEFMTPHAPISGVRQIFCRHGGQERSDDLALQLKLPTALTGPRDQIFLPGSGARPFAAVGVGAVFGRMARAETRSSVRSAIAGYMVVNDIADRGRAPCVGGRNRPGSLPTGPYLVPAAFVPSLSTLSIMLSVNGDMVLDGVKATDASGLDDAVVALTADVLALPGDILCLGFRASFDAANNRPLEDGDIIEASVAGLGGQMNNCIRS